MAMRAMGMAIMFMSHVVHPSLICRRAGSGRCRCRLRACEGGRSGGGARLVCDSVCAAPWAVGVGAAPARLARGARVRPGGDTATRARSR